MDRPFDIDVNGLVHADDECDLIAELDGDASHDGVVIGIVEHGDVPCPLCVDEEERLYQMEAAVKQWRAQ